MPLGQERLQDQDGLVSHSVQEFLRNQNDRLNL